MIFKVLVFERFMHRVRSLTNFYHINKHGETDSAVGLGRSFKVCILHYLNILFEIQVGCFNSNDISHLFLLKHKGQLLLSPVQLA